MFSLYQLSIMHFPSGMAFSLKWLVMQFLSKVWFRLSESSSQLQCGLESDSDRKVRHSAYQQLLSTLASIHKKCILCTKSVHCALNQLVNYDDTVYTSHSLTHCSDVLCISHLDLQWCPA